METVQQFEPIFGWGWHQGNSAIDVPPPFELLISSSEQTGLSGVVQEPHEFAGSNAVLSFRSESDGLLQWGVMLTGGRLSDTVTGYVQSVGYTPNKSFKPTPLRGAA
jgi:hypothetical protein